MSFLDTLTRRFVSRLLATPEGRRHVLDQSAEAESNGGLGDGRTRCNRLNQNVRSQVRVNRLGKDGRNVTKRHRDPFCIECDCLAI